MNNADRIEKYISHFSRALTALPQADRTDIVAEINAHLTHRAGEDRLDEAITALGSPQVCARGFLEELKLQEAFIDGGPGKTFGALLALASRRVTACAGLFASGLFLLLAFGFAATSVADVVAPDLAGLWVDADARATAFGVVGDASRTGATEILGRWIIPVSAALALFCFICGQWIGRFFIKAMLKK